MGCDIHAHIEYAEFEREGKPMWWHYCTFFFLRDYWLFALMAGVRAYNNETALIEPRGIPADATYETRSSYSLYVTDKDGSDQGGGECSRKSADRWVASGTSEWLTDPNDKYPRISHPDWHTPSYLTLEEMKAVIARYVAVHLNELPRANVYAAMAAMQAFEDRGLKTRLVFWFDN